MGISSNDAARPVASVALSANAGPAALVSISGVTLPEGNSGTTTFVFPVTLSAAPTVDVTVGYRVLDGSAKLADKDYDKPTSLTVTIPKGQTKGTIVILVRGDTKPEQNEDFTVKLVSATNGAINTSKAIAKGTILNDDPPSVSIGPVTKPEGNSGLTRFEFPVTLSAPPTADVTVTFQVADGTAKLTDKDYDKPTNLSVTIPKGQTKGTIVISVRGDTKLEQNEDFTVKLVSATNGTINTSMAIAKGTILNDDPPSVSIGHVTKPEGNSGLTRFEFPVTLSAPTIADVTVTFQIAAGTAKLADKDYDKPTHLSVTIPKGQTKGTIVISVRGDTKLEQNEDFTVKLVSATNGTIDTSKAIAKGTILNDDPPSVSIGHVTKREGNSGLTKFEFPVTLSAPTTADVTVTFQIAAGTAKLADKDYDKPTQLSVTIPKGQTKGTIVILVRGDKKREPDEDFTVKLTSATNAILTAGKKVGRGTILNDD